MRELRMVPGKTYAIGSHLYSVCPACGKTLKLTGFLRGIHLCAA